MKITAKTESEGAPFMWCRKLRAELPANIVEEEAARMGLPEGGEVSENHVMGWFSLLEALLLSPNGIPPLFIKDSEVEVVDGVATATVRYVSYAEYSLGRHTSPCTSARKYHEAEEVEDL
jgi:hypothetical protein